MLPLTKEILDDFDTSQTKKIALLHINHDVDDVIVLNEYLKTIFEQVIFIPVNYRASEENTVSDASHRNIFSEMHTKIKENLISLRGQKVIIIEDGGHHYSSLNAIEDPGINILGCVEQTMSGLRRALQQPQPLGCKFYSVARSKIKMRVENKFIARKVIEESSLLLNLADSFLFTRNVYVIGYGILGREIALLLKAYGCHVEVVESNSSVLEQADCDGFKAENKISRFRQNSIFIGATGVSSFGFEELELFVRSDSKKLTLISASSREIEFSEVLDYKAWISKFNLELISITGNTKYGTKILFRDGDLTKEVLIIADGRPVNFYRKDSESLPMTVIDLINAEMAHCLGKILNQEGDSNYLFGQTDIDERFEIQLLEKWGKNFGLDHSILQPAWSTFTTHPKEHVLIDLLFKNRINIEQLSREAQS